MSAEEIKRISYEQQSIGRAFRDRESVAVHEIEIPSSIEMGLSFREAFNDVFRQDPEVIFVGDPIQRAPIMEDVHLGNSCVEHSIMHEYERNENKYSEVVESLKEFMGWIHKKPKTLDLEEANKYLDSYPNMLEKQ